MWNAIENFNGEFEFLSNFYIYPVTYKGIIFRAAEYAYQWDKTNDPDWKHRIATASTCRKAKQFGRACPLRENWKSECNDVMEAILINKFSHSNLKQKLLDTKDFELIEGNIWHDNYWGDCQCEKCKNLHGQNMLGKILMKIRSGLNRC